MVELKGVEVEVWMEQEVSGEGHRGEARLVYGRL